MNKVTKVTSITLASLATCGGVFLTGERVGNHFARMNDTELTKVLRQNDTDNDNGLGFGEAIQLLDKDRNGHLSEAERKNGEELRNQFDATGRAMLRSAENLQKTLDSIENEK
jgi:hypothetical protein